MWHSSSGVRITQTAKRADMRVSRSYGKQGEKRAWRGNSFSGNAVEEVCGGVKRFNPKSSRHVSLKKQGANNIINGANNAFNFTVLWRRVWA
jgi:hypothetical protein